MRRILIFVFFSSLLFAAACKKGGDDYPAWSNPDNFGYGFLKVGTKIIYDLHTRTNGVDDTLQNGYTIEVYGRPSRHQFYVKNSIRIGDSSFAQNVSWIAGEEWRETPLNDTASGFNYYWRGMDTVAYRVNPDKTTAELSRGKDSLYIISVPAGVFRCHKIIRRNPIIPSDSTIYYTDYYKISGLVKMKVGDLNYNGYEISLREYKQ